MITLSPAVQLTLPTEVLQNSALKTIDGIYELCGFFKTNIQLNTEQLCQPVDLHDFFNSSNNR
jgi:hypothetical protein